MKRPVATAGSDTTRAPTAPLYAQVYLALAETIRRGELQPGDRLPSEQALARSYQVTSTTARRALDELRRQGLVTREPGKGTFVLPPRLDAMIPHLHSITDALEHLGYRPGIVPLSVERQRANEEVARDLRLAPGDPVLVVRRIRTADGRPVYVSEAALNLVRFPELEDVDYGSRGMYRIFESTTGSRLESATQWLSSVSATPEVAGSLCLERGAPALKLERIVYLQGQIPVETVTGYFHGELYTHYSIAYRNPPL